MRALLVIASLVTLAGGLAVVVVDLRMEGRRRVGRYRDLVEVLLPLAGLLALVAAAWMSVAGRS